MAYEKPYPYQEDFIDAFFKAVKEGQRRLLGVLPTGTGKTVGFVEIAKRMGLPTLILAHRDELIQQAVKQVREVWPDATIGVVKGKRHELDGDVTIASVQSLYKKRLETLPNQYGLIITDEAHHASAPSYRRIYHRLGLLAESPDKKPLPQFDAPAFVHLGVTATPKRSDKKGLKPIFDHIFYEGKYPDFVPEYLSDLRIRGVETDLDLSAVKVSRMTMDFSESDLSKTMNTEQISSDILRAYREFASECKRTLVFCVSREHAFNLRQLFLEADISSGYVDYKTPIDDRKETLESFRNGEIKALFNCMILTEGYDCPEIDCVLLARPTKSPLLLTQMIGRGTRIADGKADCLVIDVALFQREKDVVNVASLFNLDPSELRNDKKTLTRALADRDRHQQDWDSYVEDFADVDYSLQLTMDSIFEIRDDFEHELGWHYAPATEKQMSVIDRELAAIGEKPMANLTRGQAWAIIGKIFDATPATAKQRSYMRGLGIDVDGFISKQEAMKLIDEAVEAKEEEEQRSEPVRRRRIDNSTRAVPREAVELKEKEEDKQALSKLPRPIREYILSRPKHLQKQTTNLFTSKETLEQMERDN